MNNISYSVLMELTLGLGGRQFSNAGMTSGGMLFGKLTKNCIISNPFSNGFLYIGIPEKINKI